MILAIVGSSNVAGWHAALGPLAPDLEIRTLDNLGDLREIDAALCWRPDPGWLASLPNLKLVHSLGAGIDHILVDRHYPAHVPLVRLVDPGMTRAMVEYITFQVLRLHLQDGEYRRLQAAGLWEPRDTQPAAAERRVGILGLGELGTACGSALRDFGFDVAGWSRSPKEVLGIASYVGEAGLSDFLARTEILICLLPLTPATEGILNAETFTQLPRGAALVNAGRGRHLVEADLLAALDAGQLSEAVLDVFRTEPLPADHPFWRHPRIVVTPHVAALTNPVTAAPIVLENLRRLERGAPWPDRADLSAGY